MSRTWYHYPAGVQTEWAAGTLPHGDSVFRADFLNQFIGWIRYIDNFDSGRGLYTAPEFIDSGDAIQSASFWNSLNYQVNASSYYITSTREELLTVGADFADERLKDSAAYSATLFDDIVAGEIIQPSSSAACPVRQRLLHLRTRLDMFQVQRVPFYKNLSLTYSRWHYGRSSGWTSTTTTDLIPEGHWQDYWDDVEWVYDNLTYAAGVTVLPAESSSAYGSILPTTHGLAWAYYLSSSSWWAETDPPYVIPENGYIVAAATEEVAPAGWNAGTLGQTTAASRDHGPYTMDIRILYLPFILLSDTLPAEFLPAA